MGNLIIVDCEANGPCPSMGKLTEFGAVDFNTFKMFHGEIVNSDITKCKTNAPFVFTQFDSWLTSCGSPLIFVSDNPAFDWMWICDGFWKYLGRNPFGHSARRIGDFYAGLVNNYWQASKWKRLRITKHDHNPVHDALGNAEALKRMLAGERAR